MARPCRRDFGSELGRLLAERDRLISEGADPVELQVPLAPPDPDPDPRYPHEYEPRVSVSEGGPNRIPDPRRDRESQDERAGIGWLVIIAAVVGASIAVVLFALWLLSGDWR